jgi:hypothetical protein
MALLSITKLDQRSIDLGDHTQWVTSIMYMDGAWVWSRDSSSVSMIDVGRPALDGVRNNATGQGWRTTAGSLPEPVTVTV